MSGIMAVRLTGVPLTLSLSLFWAPCIIQADSQNTENNKIQQKYMV